jgi:hypothetical protein
MCRTAHVAHQCDTRDEGTHQWIGRAASYGAAELAARFAQRYAEVPKRLNGSSAGYNNEIAVKVLGYLAEENAVGLHPSGEEPMAQALLTAKAFSV